MKRPISQSGAVALALLVSASAAPAFAQVAIEFGSSPNPVGSGARALGIASAFIATADDATAASWNPAGLIILEKPEASLVLSLKNRNEYFGGIGIAPGKEVQRYTYPGMNYVSAAYPFKVGQRFFVAALNFQSLIDFDKQIEKTLFVSGPNIRGSYVARFTQNGSIQALSPALAFQLSPTLALGLTLNISTSKLGFGNGWQQHASYTESLFVGSTLQELTVDVRERHAFDGAGGNLGVLWDITPAWTLGAVVKTPLFGSITRTIEHFAASDGTGLTARSFHEPVQFPPSYGAGVAYRYSDELTASFDLYRTEWGLFKQRRTSFGSGNKENINPISAAPSGKAKVSGTLQAHLGGEYLFVFPRTVIPVRGGIFYDGEPSAGKTNHFFGAAVGTGISLGNVILDVAYQFRGSASMRNDVVHVQGSAGTSTTSASASDAVWQHLFYASTIYHF